MRRALWLAPVVVVGLACGSDRAISDEARRSVAALVAEVRTAAGTGQADLAAQRLAELRATVESLRQAGQIDERRAGEILAAAGQVEAHLALATATTSAPATALAPTTTAAAPTTTAAPTTVAPTTTVAPAPPDGEDDGKEDKDEDRGRGKKGRDG